jgi:hypothetical protein
MTGLLAIRLFKWYTLQVSETIKALGHKPKSIEMKEISITLEGNGCTEEVADR